MAIVQISKIQHRTGANVDLPQLAEGELGFATDERKLYIGNDANLYPPIGETTTQTEILTEYSTISLSQIDGSANANLNITSPTDGQVLALTVSGANVSVINKGGANSVGGNINLGNVANVKILGGVNGYVLQTDSTGNLSWTSQGSILSNISNISNANPMVMTISNSLPVTNAMLVTISGVSGTNANTIVNGQSFYIKVSNNYPTSGNVSLYTDSSLTTGANGFYLTATANTGRAVGQLGSGGSSGVAGSNTQVQFNDNNTFGGSANLTYNKITKTFTTDLTATVLTTAAQPNITSVGTLTSLSVTGNVTTANRLISTVATGTAPVVVSSTTRVANLNVDYANVADFINVTTGTTGNVYPIFANAVTGNVTEYANSTFVANLANGALTATTFVGALSGAATTAGTVTTAAQPNITSVGTLSSLGVSGAVTASTLISNVATGTAPLTVTSTTRVGNLNVAYANVSDFTAISTQTSGNYYLQFASAITGNIAQVGNATYVANLSNGSLSATTFVGALSGAATTAGTVTTAAQPNITSVGTLTSLAVTGNVTSSNAVVAGNNLGFYNATWTANARNPIWSFQNANTYGISYYQGNAGIGNTDTISIHPNGNVTANGAPFSVTTTGVVVRDVSTGANSTAGTLTGNWTMSSGSVLNASTINSSNVTATLLTTGANTTAGTITGNWSLSSGSQLRATYADLAEYYVGDTQYDPATVVMFGGEQEVTMAEGFATTKVAGIVSTAPAYIMNNSLSKTGVLLGLVGRVPCKVYGTINKGDLMVVGEWPGTATSWTDTENQPPVGSVIGKAIESYDDVAVGVIEIVVGRV